MSELLGQKNLIVNKLNCVSTCRCVPKQVRKIFICEPEIPMKKIISKFFHVYSIGYIQAFFMNKKLC